MQDNKILNYTLPYRSYTLQIMHHTNGLKYLMKNEFRVID
jgi:hypothetical protein